MWPGAISLWIRQRNSITFCTDLGKSATETLAMIKQAFREEGVSQIPNSPRPKKARQAKSNAKSMLIILCDINGIVNKELILAGKTVNSTYYCDVLR
jgi:hypothetical protein